MSCWPKVRKYSMKFKSPVKRWYDVQKTSRECLYFHPPSLMALFYWTSELHSILSNFWLTSYCWPLFSCEKKASPKWGYFPIFCILHDFWEILCTDTAKPDFQRTTFRRNFLENNFQTSPRECMRIWPLHVCYVAREWLTKHPNSCW